MLIDQYHQYIKANQMAVDPAQLEAIKLFERLDHGLANVATASHWLHLWWPKSKNKSPKGLYIYGEVGRGKTMLMDLFYNWVHFPSKRRCHFHEFMLDVHERIANMRKTHEGDPIAPVARQLAKEATLLCFDEFQVTDIADAMILGRLFQALFAENVVMVATSNVPIHELYKNGLNRQLFIPFIDLLHTHLNDFHLDAKQDYRRVLHENLPIYFIDETLSAKPLDELWANCADHQPVLSDELDLGGRVLTIPMATPTAGRIAFENLCGARTSTKDYISLADRFNWLFLDGVPVFQPEEINKARRFIYLIDVLYDHGTCLAMSAGAKPDDLFVHLSDEFMADRTISRLHEMMSKEFIKKHDKVGFLQL